MELTGAQVVALVGPGFEEIEFWYPVLRLREAGAQVTVLGIAGADVVSGHCSYPVIPDAAIEDYSGTPDLVIVPGLVDFPAEELRDRVGATLRSWYDAGARLVATSTGVAALALADVVKGSTVSAAESVRGLVEQAGGEVSDAAYTVAGQIASATSVDHVVDLYREVLEAAIPLTDATVAVLCENVYQELELWYPLLRLREAGAAAYTVGPRAGATFTSKLGYPVPSDLASTDIDATDFDAVVVPGGHSPENMRRSAATIDFVRHMYDRGAVVAAICHAGWVLASAGIAKGRQLTCVSIIKDDVIAAGGQYVNEQVVRDGNLITSRLPSDVHAFVAKIIEALQETPTFSRSKDKLGAPSSSPGYQTRVQLVPLAVGAASGDYTQVCAPVGS